MKLYFTWKSEDRWLCWERVKAAGRFDGGPLKPGGGATAELLTEESLCCCAPSNPEPEPPPAVLFAAAAYAW